MYIPDLNVLLYAINADSTRHMQAKEGLERIVNSGREVGLPWVVYLGFLRLATLPMFSPSPLSVDRACEWIDEFRVLPSVQLLNPGKGHAAILRHLLLLVGTGGNLTTDAHIAALALENDAVLLTGDRDFLRFPGLRTEFLY